MYSCTYINSHDIDFSRTIKNAYPVNGAKIYFKLISFSQTIHTSLWKSEKTESDSMVKNEPYNTVVLKFPTWAEGEDARCAQQYNYDYFIRFMAEMIQKYAPEIM